MKIDTSCFAAAAANIVLDWSATVVANPIPKDRHVYESLDLPVKSITYEGWEINTYELRPGDGDELPLFSAGAHIDVRLPSGQTRSYSLVNAPGECRRYVIAVSHVAHNGDGSRYLHVRLRVGEALSVSRPRNNFTLVEDAAHTLLIADGIGITPLWSMIQRLDTLQRSWEHFCARTQAVRRLSKCVERDKRCPTAPASHVRSAAKLRIAEYRGSRGGRPRAAHLHYCGPSGMLRASETACSEWPAHQMHVEYLRGKNRHRRTAASVWCCKVRPEVRHSTGRNDPLRSSRLQRRGAEFVSGGCLWKMLDEGLRRRTRSS